jgi:hypothetical protein
LVEAKSIISTIIKNFDIELIDENCDLKIMSGITNHPKNLGIRLLKK